MHRFGGLAGLFILIILAACALVMPSNAAEVLNVNNSTDVINLTPYRTVVVTDHSKLTIQPSSDQHSTDLQSVGPGAVFYWTNYSIRNSGDVDLDFSIAVDHQGFAGSGILAVKPPGAQVYQVLLTDPARPLAVDRNPENDSVSISIKPGQALGIAMQTVSPNFSARLYPQATMVRTLSLSAFLRGSVLGTAAVTFIGMLLIYAYRPNQPALTGLGFALMAIMFLNFEQGNYPPLPLSVGVTAALIESLWAASLAVCIAAFTGARKYSMVIYFLGFVIAGVMIANCAFAMIEPAKASTAARICFAALAIAGFLLTLRWRHSATGIVDRSLAFWTLLLIWTFVSAIAALQPAGNIVVSRILAGILALVLVVLALELLRYVIAVLATKPFFTDQGRRSLALTSAGHSMWDFRTGDGTLEVSEDLPRLLGYAPIDWQGDVLWLFKSILDPMDTKAYELDVEQAALRPNAVIERDLRLRDAEGRWRWFHLKARTVPAKTVELTRCIGTLTEITGSKLAEARQSVDALWDPVTNLPTRSLFMDRLERELGKASTSLVQLMMVEIENFKSLNESLGHENGDRLLQSIGARILASVEPHETVARLSGGQFGIILIDEKGRRDAKALAATLVDVLSQTVTLPHYLLNLGANIGLSRPARKGNTAEDLLQQANVALLQAGLGTQGHVVAYTSDLKDERAAQFLLEADLRRAVTNNEIEVYFQPICDLETGVIAGYEALARWRHPRQGLLLPQQFIDLAERIGLIGEIGDIVLAGAARHLGIWQRVARQDSTFFVSVNVSVTHLMEERFLNRVQTVVEREALLPSTLKIEITESVIMRQPERVLHIMQELHELGVGLACDDFGTGFSSLASLRDLPFDTLKLDRSFIAAEIMDERSTVIISAIADMAHSLGMILVAEGIERQEQIDVLSELGCDLGQGYLIGMAQTAKAVSESLGSLPRYVAPQSRVPAPPRQVELGTVGRVEIPAPKTTFTPEPSPVAEIKVPAAAPVAEPETLPSLFTLQTEPKEEEKPQPTVRKPTPRPRKRPNRNQPVSP